MFGALFFGLALLFAGGGAGAGEALIGASPLIDYSLSAARLESAYAVVFCSVVSLVLGVVLLRVFVLWLGGVLQDDDRDYKQWSAQHRRAWGPESLPDD